MDIRELAYKGSPTISIQLPGRPIWLAPSLRSDDTQRLCLSAGTNPSDIYLAKSLAALSYLDAQGPDESQEPSTNPRLDPEIIESLSEEELTEFARQYLAGSAQYLARTKINDELPLESLKQLLLSERGKVVISDPQFEKSLRDIAALSRQISPPLVDSMVKAQASINAMTNYLNSPTPALDRFESLSFQYRNTGAEMLSALQDINESANHQNKLQVDALIALNNSVTELVRETTKQAAKSDKHSNKSITLAWLTLAASVLTLLFSVYVFTQSDEKSELASSLAAGVSQVLHDNRANITPTIPLKDAKK